MPAWAIRKAAFVDAGGFDPVLWHVGLLEDLAARLTGVPILSIARRRWRSPAFRRGRSIPRCARSWRDAIAS